MSYRGVRSRNESCLIAVCRFIVVALVELNQLSKESHSSVEHFGVYIKTRKQDRGVGRIRFDEIHSEGHPERRQCRPPPEELRLGLLAVLLVRRSRAI
ncbi:hypothetical protein AVEN_261686-1 [Araneus ventricosus]|uniref:Uncharacterized protein n=1 Tax=Araneus ventricosus TaxID=182803 RepID=A0A4Y2DWW7_ARAVE|nr:hypothetical protein AVEN_261686-1 [Araneus ventricosus]